MSMADVFAEAKEHLSTICDFVRFGATQFEKNELFYGHGTDNAWDDAAFIVLHTLALPPDSPDEVYAARLTPIEKSEILTKFLERIEKRLPSPYVTNEAWFCNMAFYVDERVLVPRSPVAELIEASFTPWIDPVSVERVVDVGTGSGCIACAIAEVFPGARVDAIDISRDALDVAKINVKQHGLEDNVRLVESDCLEEVLDQQYDVIISNPPYVDKEAMAALPKEYLNEPQSALSGGDTGIDFAITIMRQAQTCLAPGGILIVEVGDSQAALEEAFPTVAFTWLSFERGGHGVFLLNQSELAEIDLPA